MAREVVLDDEVVALSLTGEAPLLRVVEVDASPDGAVSDEHAEPARQHASASDNAAI